MNKSTVAICLIAGLIIILQNVYFYYTNAANAAQTFVNRGNCDCESSESKPEQRVVQADESEYEANMQKNHKLNMLLMSTLRNCLGRKCFDELPKNSAYDRVGLLGMPYSGSEQVDDILQEILSTSSKSVSSPHIIHSSNVPAYGYGKNHGWSRIIRIARMPVDHAFTAIYRYHSERNQHGNVSDISESLVDAQVHVLGPSLRTRVDAHGHSVSCIGAYCNAFCGIHSRLILLDIHNRSGK